MAITEPTRVKIALTWCLGWGENREPNTDITALQQMREDLKQEGKDTAIPSQLQGSFDLVQSLQAIPNDPDDDLLVSLQKLKDHYPKLWEEQTPIGLVYGGATKIKNYVFESANLTEIRGASAILDRINLIDLPAFFNKCPENQDLQTNFNNTRTWLGKSENYPDLLQALIPELIIYSTGGNILAFCPAAYVDDLANAIEKRYTTETLTANSCAVGNTFRLLEMRLGRLQTPFENTLWFDWYQNNYSHPIVESYYGKVDSEDNLKQHFFNRKSFNEIAGKLASLFNQRRSGNLHETRPSRCYPPRLETHPYLMRDENDRASALTQADDLASEPYFSEPLARKYLMGQKAKRENTSQNWYNKTGLTWKPGEVESWVKRFETFLDNADTNKFQQYYQDYDPKNVTEARNLEEIANASQSGYISFIYADGNNMGRYIQTIKTPEAYMQFSRDIFEATENSVYEALAKHLTPHQLGILSKRESKKRPGSLIHPFEIITIGGDDVILIVPAEKALPIAKTLGEQFEAILGQKPFYQRTATAKSKSAHRYNPDHAPASTCQLSMSIGVLTIDYKTPIYYAEKLGNQLLKSAKKRAKYLKDHYHYYGGTVDILALKSVTMIASNIEAFRDKALKLKLGNNHLNLLATPYTFHELGGVIETIQAFKQAEFPRSQLYQVRSFLARGKRSAILNYRYFTARLEHQKQQLLRDKFESVWCVAKTNNGNLAPWMYDQNQGIYETIWYDLVDFYLFVEASIPSSVTSSKS